MKNYWCENCGKRFQSEEKPSQCPDPSCQSVEIRPTMSKEEAEKLGLINE